MSLSLSDLQRLKGYKVTDPAATDTGVPPQRTRLPSSAPGSSKTDQTKKDQQSKTSKDKGKGKATDGNQDGSDSDLSDAVDKHWEGLGLMGENKYKGTGTVWDYDIYKHIVYDLARMIKKFNHLRVINPGGTDQTEVHESDYSFPRGIDPLFGRYKLPTINSRMTTRQPKGTPSPDEKGAAPAPMWVRLDGAHYPEGLPALKARFSAGFDANGGWDGFSQYNTERILPAIYGYQGEIQREDYCMSQQLEGVLPWITKALHRDPTLADVGVTMVPPWDEDGNLFSGEVMEDVPRRDFMVFINQWGQKRKTGQHYTGVVVNQRNGVVLFYDPSWGSISQTNSETMFMETIEHLRGWYRRQGAPDHLTHLLGISSFVFEGHIQQDGWACGVYVVDFIRALLREGRTNSQSMREYMRQDDNTLPEYNEGKEICEHWKQWVTLEFGPPGKKIQGLRKKPELTYDNWMAKIRGSSRPRPPSAKREADPKGLLKMPTIDEVPNKDKMTLEEAQSFLASEIRRREYVNRWKIRRQRRREAIKRGAEGPEDMPRDYYLAMSDDIYEEVAMDTVAWAPFLPPSRPAGWDPAEIRSAANKWDRAAELKKLNAERESVAGGRYGLRKRK